MAEITFYKRIKGVALGLFMSLTGYLGFTSLSSASQQTPSSNSAPITLKLNKTAIEASKIGPMVWISNDGKDKTRQLYFVSKELTSRPGFLNRLLDNIVAKMDAPAVSGAQIKAEARVAPQPLPEPSRVFARAKQNSTTIKVTRSDYTLDEKMLQLLHPSADTTTLSVNNADLKQQLAVEEATKSAQIRQLQKENNAQSWQLETLQTNNRAQEATIIKQASEISTLENSPTSVSGPNNLVPMAAGAVLMAILIALGAALTKPFRRPKQPASAAIADNSLTPGETPKPDVAPAITPENDSAFVPAIAAAKSRGTGFPTVNPTNTFVPPISSKRSYASTPALDSAPSPSPVSATSTAPAQTSERVKPVAEIILPESMRLRDQEDALVDQAAQDIIEGKATHIETPVIVEVSPASSQFAPQATQAAVEQVDRATLLFAHAPALPQDPISTEKRNKALPDGKPTAPTTIAGIPYSTALAQASAKKKLSNDLVAQALKATAADMNIGDIPDDNGKGFVISFKGDKGPSLFINNNSIRFFKPNDEQSIEFVAAYLANYSLRGGVLSELSRVGLSTGGEKHLDNRLDAFFPIAEIKKKIAQEAKPKQKTSAEILRENVAHSVVDYKEKYEPSSSTLSRTQKLRLETLRLRYGRNGVGTKPATLGVLATDIVHKIFEAATKAAHAEYGENKIDILPDYNQKGEVAIATKGNSPHLFLSQTIVKIKPGTESEPSTLIVYPALKLTSGATAAECEFAALYVQYVAGHFEYTDAPNGLLKMSLMLPEVTFASDRERQLLIKAFNKDDIIEDDKKFYLPLTNKLSPVAIASHPTTSSPNNIYKSLSAYEADKASIQALLDNGVKVAAEVDETLWASLTQRSETPSKKNSSTWRNLVAAITGRQQKAPKWETEDKFGIKIDNAAADFMAKPYMAEPEKTAITEQTSRPRLSEAGRRAMRRIMMQRRDSDEPSVAVDPIEKPADKPIVTPVAEVQPVKPATIISPKLLPNLPVTVTFKGDTSTEGAEKRNKAILSEFFSANLGKYIFETQLEGEAKVGRTFWLKNADGTRTKAFTAIIHNGKTEFTMHVMNEATIVPDGLKLATKLLDGKLTAMVAAPVELHTLTSQIIEMAMKGLLVDRENNPLKHEEMTFDGKPIMKLYREMLDADEAVRLAKAPKQEDMIGPILPNKVPARKPRELKAAE